MCIFFRHECLYYYCCHFVCGSSGLPHSQMFRCVLKPDELDDGYDLYSRCHGSFLVNLRGYNFAEQ